MGAELNNPLESQTPPSPDLWGTVLAVQANFYWVQLDPRSGGKKGVETLLCTRRSRLKKIGQRVIVGDRVVVEEPDWAGGRGAIAQVLPRQTELDRPPIANVNQILLVFALAEPNLDSFQLSHFLVKAESTGLDVSLCLNKNDLLSAEAQEQWSAHLQHWGYTPLLISTHNRSNLTLVQAQLAHKITVVSGPSGVGKSSLINQLIPDAALRVGAVSGKLGRGRHTTRHVELFELPYGGLLADTPGFNQPDLTCTPQELAQCFPEVRQRLQVAVCQFSNCLHRDEPNCAVRGDWERYEHYRVFLEEAIQRQIILEHSADTEPVTKQKVGQDGHMTSEPLLETKKYRRPSRRTQKQTLHHLYEDANEGSLDDDCI